MILCGGQGTRLREHTEIRPKPMIEIGGRPILWHIMKLYAHHGIREFVLCLGYKANVIKDYFLNYETMNSDFSIELGKKNSLQLHNDASNSEGGWKISLVFTGENTMTGARVRRASAYLGNTGETFCVTYGDGVSNVDLTAALKFHRSHGKLATLTGVHSPSRFGVLECTGSKVEAFAEKPTSKWQMINGGFFFFEPGFLDYIKDDENCVLERAPLESCAAEGQLQLYEHTGYWQCMDTYRDWDLLEKQWQAGRAPWKVWA